MDDFLGMFKDTIFVSISKAGGHVLHTRDLGKALARNTKEFKEGAYFTVNGFANFKEGGFRGRTKQNVTSFNASFLDIDLTPETRHMQAELVYKGLCETGLQPTAVVVTGKGLHVYWVYREPAQFSEYKLKEYEILQEAIVSHFEKDGADRQARDAARVLRVPKAAYFDSKGEHTCDVKLLYLHPERRYDPIDIARHFKNAIHIETKAGEELLRLTGDGYDLSKAFNVRKGAMHGSSYSLALSLLQRVKDISSARDMYQAIISTWEQPVDMGKCWIQFDNAVKMLEKDRPQLFIADPEAASIGFSSFEDIEDERLEWLWDGFIAKGKSHVLAGLPGLGKSQVTIDIAARLSTGRPLPSYTLGAGRRDPVGVIILSAEDGAADTIKPRLKAAGADMRRVFSMKSSKLVRNRNNQLSMSGVSLMEDAEAILRGIATLPFQVELIIVDPASAFMSRDQDSNSNSDVRATFAQLQAVIMDKGIAMLMINHLNKNLSAKTANMRSMGSGAWTAVARGTFYAMADREVEGRMIFSPDKTNLAKKAGKGFFYSIKDREIEFAGDFQVAPYIEWEESAFPVKTTDEYMADEGRRPPKVDECSEELEMYMAGQEAAQGTAALRHMKERGFTQASAYKAARRLGIAIGDGIWRKAA